MREGKKVKIRTENFNKNKHWYSKKFLKFISQNKNKIYTLKKVNKYPNGFMWTFVEDDTWLFAETDLEKIKK